MNRFGKHSFESKAIAEDVEKFQRVGFEFPDGAGLDEITLTSSLPLSGIDTLFLTSNTFISNTRLKIVKFLGTFKQNAEAQLSHISFKQRYSTLKLTAMSDRNLKNSTFLFIKINIISIPRRQFQNLMIKAHCSKYSLKKVNPKHVHGQLTFEQGFLYFQEL